MRRIKLTSTSVVGEAKHMVYAQHQQRYEKFSSLQYYSFENFKRKMEIISNTFTPIGYSGSAG
jgi:hypothetical protein